MNAILALFAHLFGCLQVGDSQRNTWICRSPTLYWPPHNSETLANYFSLALLLCRIACLSAHF